jgi:hypothetical protein
LPVGKSLVEADLWTARDLGRGRGTRRAAQLPVDHVVAEKLPPTWARRCDDDPAIGERMNWTSADDRACEVIGGADDRPERRDGRSRSTRLPPARSA